MLVELVVLMAVLVVTAAHWSAKKSARTELRQQLQHLEQNIAALERQTQLFAESKEPDPVEEVVSPFDPLGRSVGGEKLRAWADYRVANAIRSDIRPDLYLRLLSPPRYSPIRVWRQIVDSYHTPAEPVSDNFSIGELILESCDLDFYDFEHAPMKSRLTRLSTHFDDTEDSQAGRDFIHGRMYEEMFSG